MTNEMINMNLMQGLKTCSRCGKKYVPYPRIKVKEVCVVFIDDNFELIKQRYDLCDNCIEELMVFLTGGQHATEE